MIKYFKILEKEYGTQQKAADKLCITLRHYNRIRKDNDTASGHLINYIKQLAKNIETAKQLKP